MDRNEASKNIGSLEDAFKGSPVSRRWVLRSSASAAAGVIAVSAFGQGATPAQAETAKAAAAGVEVENAHADKPAGYVHSLHGWDTI
jgi:hypothetical protein